jgi:hypothetical protein
MELPMEALSAGNAEESGPRSDDRMLCQMFSIVTKAGFFTQKQPASLQFSKNPSASSESKDSTNCRSYS